MDGFWQGFANGAVEGPPFIDRYAVELAPGRWLVLPIRVLPGGRTAVASFIANQASFSVLDLLTERMAALAVEVQPDVVVGLPTLGLAFAPGVARRLGHENFVPLGYSRKFWYRDDMSVPIRSITSPGEGKRLYIDPLILPRLADRRVVVIDDVASTGASLGAVAALLGTLGIAIEGCVVAMRQGAGTMPLPVRSVFQPPRFVRRADGWWPI
ncbi:phosphoribosyltransferase [Acidisoma sp.]|uniref:phosphoribosyltransferase n=1 Tax=Acidisoma sp. TaxID=1872115 RepID=UPI003AFFFB9B